MKTKHRHELKTNELAEWLSNLPQWAKENLTSIIIFCILAGGAVGGFIYYRYQTTVIKARQQQLLTKLITRLPRLQTTLIRASAGGRDRSFELINLAKRLRNFANKTKNNTTAAIALIRCGDAYRAELHYRPEIVRKADLRKQINQAKRAYQQALERLGDTPNDPRGPTTKNKKTKTGLSTQLLAAAKFKIGLCEEELDNFEKAKEIYNTIIQTNEFKITTTYAQARERLAIIPDLRKKITFRISKKTTPAAPPELLRSNVFRDINTGPNAPIIESAPVNKPVSANLGTTAPVEIKTKTVKPASEATIKTPNSNSNEP